MHTLIYLKSDRVELRVSIIGHQYPDASPVTLDAEWLLFRVEVDAPEGSWSRDDPSELAPRILDLPDWFLHHGEGRPDIEKVYLFTDQTLILKLVDLGSERHCLRVKIQYELLDRDVIDADEFNLDFIVTREDLFRISSQARNAIAAYPPRVIEVDDRFGHLHTSETGYWINWFNLYPIAETHISAIIKEPELFGLTESDVRDKYADHNEKIGVEGEAREELIRQASQNGWIRVRHYRRPHDYWSIQCSRIDEQIRDILRFVEFAVIVKIMRPDDEVRLLGYADGTALSFPFQSGGATMLMTEFGDKA